MDFKVYVVSHLSFSQLCWVHLHEMLYTTDQRGVLPATLIAHRSLLAASYVSHDMHMF